MPSTILDPIAAALVTAAESISGVAGHKWVLRDTDSRPAAVVELPTVNRIPVDEAEDHLGFNDWRSDWTVGFYFDLNPNTGYGQAQALEVIEAWIAAVDADQSLGGVVQEAKVISVGPAELNEEMSRPLIVYPTRVEVLDFVAS